MNLLLRGKTFYIVNKKPQMAFQIEIKESVLSLLDTEGKVLENGCMDLKTDVYACLFSRKLKNITFIVNGKKIFSGALILADETQMEDVLRMLKSTCSALAISEQNIKINGYAASVVEKLQEGTKLTIMETKEEQVKCCPVCGMECDPNIPYCMECGTPV